MVTKSSSIYVWQLFIKIKIEKKGNRKMLI